MSRGLWAGNKLQWSLTRKATRSMLFVLGSWYDPFRGLRERSGLDVLESSQRGPRLGKRREILATVCGVAGF